MIKIWYPIKEIVRLIVSVIKFKINFTSKLWIKLICEFLKSKAWIFLNEVKNENPVIPA